MSDRKVRAPICDPEPLSTEKRISRKGLSSQTVRYDAYSRHIKYLQNYYLSEGKELPSFTPKIRTDFDVLKESYRFIRTEKDDVGDEWEIKLARNYYNRLYREYCIADLSRWKEKKIGMRWRTEQEVLEGKGQFICGAVGCDSKDQLTSYEVNFSYRENHETKQALVKLRLCPECSYRMWPNLRKKREEELKKREKLLKKSKNKHLSSRERTERQQSRPDQRHSQGLKAEPLSQAPSQSGVGSYDSSASPSGCDLDVPSESGEEASEEEASEEEEEEEEEEEAEGIDVGSEKASGSAGSKEEDAAKIWSAPLPAKRTREDDFESYFEGMFL